MKLPCNWNFKSARAARSNLLICDSSSCHDVLCAARAFWSQGPDLANALHIFASRRVRGGESCALAAGGSGAFYAGALHLNIAADVVVAAGLCLIDARAFELQLMPIMQRTTHFNSLRLRSRSD